jgi:uncharacterized protein YdiU (UPF0061 family)
MLEFDNTYCKLPDSFFVHTHPTAVKKPSLLIFNDELFHDLNPGGARLSDSDLALHLSGNALFEGSNPIACAYAGHQFGHFVPSLGDGRAILLGEVVATKKRRYDIQLKGSGPTAYSRRGDGRAALGPVLREYLVSEAMHKLGIPTTRSLAAVLTGENVFRETTLPGAILTRVASSHIRVGTFEYFAARKDLNNLKRLTDYTLERHFPDLKTRPEPILSMLESIVDRIAYLVAKWMGVGFIHGVMNTDNMAITGETIDYGPCAFLDEYDPSAVFSSIDTKGRYAFKNQAGIAKWNITSLIYCLAPMIDGFSEDLISSLHQRFDDKFATHWLVIFGRKIGLHQPSSDHESLVKEYLELIHKTKTDFTLGYQYLIKLLKDAPDSNAQALRPDYVHESFYDWIEKWHVVIGSQGYHKSQTIELMSEQNPVIIPRNHIIEEIIQDAYLRDDFSSFLEFNKALENPFKTPFDPEQRYQQPPSPAQKVRQTFCGT